MYVMLALLSLCGAGIGFMVSSISNNINQNSLIATGVIMPILAFTGLIANLSLMPKWYGWLQYLSPSRFTFNGLCISQWSNSPYELAYTEQLGFETRINYGDCVIALIVLALFFRVCGLAALSQKIKKFH
jgi:ABC-type multidrug transport system permease subunit